MNYKNSFVQLKADPKNNFDPNAIAVFCRGEAYGQLGYVAKEYTSEIRAILPEEGKPEDLICKVVDWTNLEQGTVLLAAIYIDGEV